MKRIAGQHERFHSQLGVAVVEMALILPIMLVLLFGVVDFGRIVLIRQVMINVTREAANLASRGTPLEDAITAVQMSSSPLDLETNGFVILTEVFRDSNGAVKIRKQVSSGSRPGTSAVGSAVGGPASLPPTPTPIPPAGETLYIAEVYYHSLPITPLGGLIDSTIGDTFYDSAYF